MNQRRNSPRRACTLALIVACRIGLVLSLVAIPARAQQITTLIEFTNVWKYDQSGLDLGTAWRTNDYDDSAWRSGKGLIGFEDVIAPYLINAPFSTPITPTTTITTYYFRATFNFSGAPDTPGFTETRLIE